jgi:hypothetical protein
VPVVVASTFNANQIAGTFTVNATAEGLGTPAPFSLRNTPDTAHVIDAQAGGGQFAVVGTPFPNPLRAIVRDPWGNPVQGVTVTFTSPSTGASCNFAGNSVAIAITDSLGIASIAAIANQIKGSYDVEARVSGILSVAFFGLTNLPAAPAAIVASNGTQQSAQIGTVFQTNLEATVRDVFGNLVPDALVRFIPPPTGPSGTFEGSIDTSRTNQDGVATARPFRANNIAGQYAVHARVDSVATTNPFLLTNLNGPPGSIEILSGGTPQVAQVMTTFGTRFKVRIRDAAGNHIPDVVVAEAP